MKNGFFVLTLLTFLFSSAAVEAKTKGFRVSLRVGIAGAAPIAINSYIKNGKKTSISEFSNDGRSETLVEMIAQRSHMNNRKGIWMDVTVSKKVNGKVKATEKTQLFTFENEEAEVRLGARGKGREDLSLAVLAHESDPNFISN